MTSCSKKASDNGGSSLVSFSLPANFGNGALSGAACFAVSIVADDIDSVSPGSCDSKYGVFGGLAPLGGAIELKAPRGEARTIEIFYVISDNGCSKFDPTRGLGEVYGSNNVYRVSQIQDVDFDKPEVYVEAPIQYPTSANAIKALLTTPASCDISTPIISIANKKQASPVIGEYRGTTDLGSPVHVRVVDKQNFGSSKMKPIRLGVGQ